MTSRPSCDDKCHYQDPCCNKQLILTGGDDAKIVLSQLSIFCILNEGNSLTKETNVELTTSVTSLAEVSLHVSQVTGKKPIDCFVIKNTDFSYGRILQITFVDFFSLHFRRCMTDDTMSIIIIKIRFHRIFRVFDMILANSTITLKYLKLLHLQ